MMVVAAGLAVGVVLLAVVVICLGAPRHGR